MYNLKPRGLRNIVQRSIQGEIYIIFVDEEKRENRYQKRKVLLGCTKRRSERRGERKVMITCVKGKDGNGMRGNGGGGKGKERNNK